MALPRIEPAPAGMSSSLSWTLLAVMLGIAGAIGFAADASSSDPGRATAAFLASATCVALLRVGATSRTRRGRYFATFLIGTLVVLVSMFGAWIILTGLSVLGLIFGRIGPAQDKHAHVQGSVDSRLQDVVRSMVLASEIRDHQTADHSDRVARNCRVVGEFLGLTADDIVALEWAARVHDVGKAAIPREILQKPAPLTESEMKIVKQHCDFGADMLVAASEDLRPIARLVRHHHENWDGTGYPVGLIANEIPLESRIISVIDMYEALTSERPYRPAMEAAAAHTEVVLRSGTKFDPDVVRVFDELWRRGRIEAWSLRRAPSGQTQSRDDIVVGDRFTVFARMELTMQ